MFAELDNLALSFVAGVGGVVAGCVACDCVDFGEIFLDELHFALQNPVYKLSLIVLLVNEFIELVKVFLKKVRQELGDVQRRDSFKQRSTGQRLRLEFTLLNEIFFE